MIGELTTDPTPFVPLRERSERHPLKPRSGWRQLSEAPPPSTRGTILDRKQIESGPSFAVRSSSFVGLRFTFE
jgi:hypothetical protein